MTDAAFPFDWIQRHTAGAVRQGVRLEDLLANALIGPEDGVISPSQRVLLCMNTVLTLEDATHGLGRSAMGAAYPAIGLRMALGSANLDAALQAIGRFYALASNGVGLKLATEQDIATLSVHMETEAEEDGAYLEENFLIWVFIQCLYILGRPPPIFEVTLRDPRHFSLGRRHWGIGGPVRYGAVTSFSFPRRLLGQPPAARAGDNILWDCHQPWLAFVGGTPTAPSADYLGAGGFVRFADMVRASGTSANTLRRRLQAAGSGFRDERRRTLARLAEARLRASADSVEAVAAELGYSDARSFRRFLKAATGLTPQQVRARRPEQDLAVEARAREALRAISARMNV